MRSVQKMKQTLQMLVESKEKNQHEPVAAEVVEEALNKAFPRLEDKQQSPTEEIDKSSGEKPVDIPPPLEEKMDTEIDTALENLDDNLDVLL